MRIVLLVLVLTACKGGSDSGDAIAMHVITGYEPAVHGDTIYVPCDAFHEDGYCKEAGTAFLMWAGAREKERGLIPNGTPITHEHYGYVPHFSTAFIIQAICEAKTNQAGAIACTNPPVGVRGGTCEMWIALDYPEQPSTEAVWAHECAHCVRGRFHGRMLATVVQDGQLRTMEAM